MCDRQDFDRNIPKVWLANVHLHRTALDDYPGRITTMTAGFSSIMKSF
jgi:hypothetical protein